MGSVVAACGLSCSLACGILVPQPGIEPTSPILPSRFLTLGLPGKSPLHSKGDKKLIGGFELGSFIQWKDLSGC